MRLKISKDLNIKLNILKELGYDRLKDKQFEILDFGCGAGKRVQELRSLDYQAFGCDIQFKYDDNVNTEQMSEKGIIRIVDMQPYKLPFDDNTFDFIFSEQVFEHVKNYSETISEINRILKPEGFCLHIFPSKYRPKEAHVYVPFSSIIQSYWWLFIWAKIGVRRKNKIGLSAKETAISNQKYLVNNTNYLSKKEIVNSFKLYFNDISFCEKYFLKYSPRGTILYKLSNAFPFIPLIFSTFRTRVLFTKSPKLKNNIVQP